MSILFHIVKKDAWLKALDLNVYEPESLKKEGFIHFSTSDQLLKVANTRFKGQEDLLVLIVAEKSLITDLRYEDCADEGDQFPHLYRKLKSSEVVSFVDFRPHNDGTFTLPLEITNLIKNTI